MNVHFGDCGVRFARSFLHPTFNHHHKEVFILKIRFFILYFVRVSYIQGCQELIVKKVCDSLNFSFKLFIEALPLVIIFYALKFCIESLLSNHLALCWCFALKLFMVFHRPSHALKLLWFLVIFMGGLKLYFEVLGSLVGLWMHWSFTLFSSKILIWLGALKLYCVEALGFLVVFWVHWSFILKLQVF